MTTERHGTASATATAGNLHASGTAPTAPAHIATRAIIFPLTPEDRDGQPEATGRHRNRRKRRRNPFRHIHRDRRAQAITFTPNDQPRED